MQFGNQHNNTGGSTFLAPLHQPSSVAKVLAAVIFIVLPFVGLYIGFEFGRSSSAIAVVPPAPQPGQESPEVTPAGERAMAPADESAVPPVSAGKLKADTFTGILEEVNTGCFADGECYVVVDGKHITVLRGWSRETVGSIVGAESIGDLEPVIGQQVEVYAQDLTATDEGYTLYGSDGFYVKVLK